MLRREGRDAPGAVLPSTMPQGSVRVALVIPKYGLLGGAESFAFELGERLAGELDFEIHVLANRWRSGKAPIIFHKIPMFRFPRLLRQPSFGYFVKKAALPGAFDLIHAHDRIFRMDLFSMHGIPHQRWVSDVRRKRMSLFDKTMSWVEARGLRRLPPPFVMPVSELVRKHLLDHYPQLELEPSQVQVIHPGVALERFASLDRETCRILLRNRHGCLLSDVVALFVGMNFEIKGLDLVLEAMALQRARRQVTAELKLLVVGKGDQDRYRGLARSLGLAENVMFAGPTTAVEQYFLAADLFVMPSRFDTFGMAVLEAMAAGLPVVISPTVGAKDLVRTGINGYVLRDDSLIEDMADALTSLMDSKTRRYMGDRARKTASAHDWSRVAEKLAALYRSMAGPHRAS